VSDNIKGERMSEVEFVRSNWEWDRDYPFSALVRTGKFLWLAGLTALDAQGEIVGPGDIQAQARQVFTNMAYILGKVGCDLTSIIRLTNYFTVSLEDADVMHKYWEVRREFFGDHHPASSGMQVAALMTPDMLLEIDAVAYASNA
jgi:enamine deaminase RidA (YjgF/YER057c/UK114 family)